MSASQAASRAASARWPGTGPSRAAPCTTITAAAPRRVADREGVAWPGRLAMPPAYAAAAGVVVLTGRLLPRRPEKRSDPWTWACAAAAR